MVVGSNHRIFIWRTWCKRSFVVSRFLSIVQRRLSPTGSTITTQDGCIVLYMIRINLMYYGCSCCSPAEYINYSVVVYMCRLLTTKPTFACLKKPAGSAKAMIFHTGFQHFWGLAETKTRVLLPPSMYLGPEPDDVITMETVKKDSTLPAIDAEAQSGRLSVSPCPISGHRPSRHQRWSLVRHGTEWAGLPCLGWPRHPQSWLPGRGNALAPGRCPRGCTTLWQQTGGGKKGKFMRIIWNIKENVG